MLNAVAGFGTSIMNRVPEFGAKRAGVVLSFYFIEKYLCSAKPKIIIDNNSKKQKIPPAPYKVGINGLSKGIQIVACLGATRIFKSNWISVPTSAAILITSVALPLKAKIPLPLGNKYSGLAKTVLNGLEWTTGLINTFAIALLAKSYLPQLADQAQMGLSKVGIDVNLGSHKEFFQSLVSKTPEIGKIRGAVEVLSLMVESYNWMDDRQYTDDKVVFTSLSKIIQVVACLGTLPQLASYKAYVPAVIGATLVAGYASVTIKTQKNKNYVNITKTFAHPLNLFVKAVNSIAVGVLINKSFKNPSQNKLIIGTATMFALSSYNMYKDWYKGW